MINFIKLLQASDERTKRRWLVMASAVMMIIVVFVWLNYFNTLVQQTGSPAPQEQTVQGLGFWQTFKTGFGIISQGIGGKIKGWFEMLGASKSYNIQP